MGTNLSNLISQLRLYWNWECLLENSHFSVNDSIKLSNYACEDDKLHTESVPAAETQTLANQMIISKLLHFSQFNRCYSSWSHRKAYFLFGMHMFSVELHLSITFLSFCCVPYTGTSCVPYTGTSCVPYTGTSCVPYTGTSCVPYTGTSCVIGNKAILWWYGTNWEVISQCCGIGAIAT